MTDWKAATLHQAVPGASPALQPGRDRPRTLPASVRGTRAPVASRPAAVTHRICG